MKWQSAILTLSTILIAPIALAACASLDFKEAQPENYMGFDCDQLDQLAESYRTQSQVGLFLDDDISEQERLGKSPDDFSPGQTRANQNDYELEWEREKRSIALARRAKNCR